MRWKSMEFHLIHDSSSIGLTIPDAVCTVMWYWWWAEEPPGTCRAIYRDKLIEKKLHFVGCTLEIRKSALHYFVQRSSTAPTSGPNNLNNLHNFIRLFFKIKFQCILLFTPLSSPQFPHSLVRISRLPVRAACLVHWLCHGSGPYTSAFNLLNAELKPICHLLALLGAHHFLHVSRIRVKSLILRLLMSYIYGAPILDVSRSHTTTHHSR